jgi:hypothetical protein
MGRSRRRTSCRVKSYHFGFIDAHEKLCELWNENATLSDASKSPAGALGRLHLS